MIRCLAIQHTYSEFLGALEAPLERRGVGFVYQRPVTGQDLAGSALQFDALWLLGAPYAPDDRAHCPWLDDELRLIRVFLKAQRPVIGLGFGALLLALACGGEARAAPPVARLVEARRSAEAADDPLAAALDARTLIEFTAGAVSLPAGARPLLADEHGQWLAARVAPLAYALRIRPELKPGMIEDLIMEDGLPLPEDIGTLLEQARAAWPQLEGAAEATLGALVSALDLMHERRKAPVFTLKAVSGDE